MSADTISRRVGFFAGLVFCLALSGTPLASPACAQPQGGRPNREASNRQHYDHPAYHFRTEDRDRLYSHYHDADQWSDRRDRHEYYEGQRLEGDWETGMRPIPADYTHELPPLPAGYVFGYSDGYAVAYSPTTHIVADVVDLAATAAAQ